MALSNLLQGVDNPIQLIFGIIRSDTDSHQPDPTPKLKIRRCFFEKEYREILFVSQMESNHNMLYRIEMTGVAGILAQVLGQKNRILVHIANGIAFGKE